jgi:site-specific DNA-cytosine methylase
MGSREGLAGEKSKLFFEFVRALKEVQPRYFLLENNASMSKENRDIISSYMGCEPVLINSANFSAQTRKRLYWTNIPIGEYEPKNILIQDILQNDIPRECVTDKIDKYVFSGEYAGRKIEKTTRNSIRTPEQKSRTIGTCSMTYQVMPEFALRLAMNITSQIKWNLKDYRLCPTVTPLFCRLKKQFLELVMVGQLK